MKILAFGHRKRVGKDTAAKTVSTWARLNLMKNNVQKRGLADKLKDVCHQLYAWAGLQPGEYYEEHQAEKEQILILLGKSPRTIWIEFGTLVGRHVYPFTWTDYLIKSSTCDILILSDVRFPNEADRVLALGGRVYKIEASNRIPSTSDLADDALSGYTKWSGVLENNGTLHDFHKVVLDEVKPWLSDTMKSENNSCNLKSTCGL